MTRATEPRSVRARATGLAFTRLALPWASAFVLSMAAAPKGLAATNFCAATAATLFEACGNETRDDAATGTAKCINLEDVTERRACLREVVSQRIEAGRECRQLRKWRLEACKRLGPDRYDPPTSPSLFDDPKNPSNANPYFPLKVGNLWEFRGGNEVNTVEVVAETKLIDGVACIVFRDLVYKDGHLAESTDDWYVPAKDGAVWYFGEEVKDFEVFPGDVPQRPELVKVDGSFKAGRNGDKPGVIFPAAPAVGQSYLEEFSLGNAEDVTDVLSTTYEFGADPELDQFVPKALVQALCAGDCVVTKNYSLLEPGVFAWKYYARGIGFFLEVDPDSGGILQLTSCNVDPRCSALPPL